jgi:hypothetical protein
MGDLGVLALFIFGTIIAAGLLLALIFGVICSAQYLFGDLPYSMQNHRIRERIAELKTSGFAPTHQHIFGGGGVAVDGPGKRVFLANGETMALYNVEDIMNVESDFKNISPTLRFTVRDLKNPFYEISGSSLSFKPLRAIDSLLTVMRQAQSVVK